MKTHSTIVALIFFLLAGSSLYSQNSRSSVKNKPPMQYHNVGPTKGGRVTTVAGVPLQPNVFYMGATGGGVWKTSDYGLHWNNISDGFFFTPSIGSIAVHSKNPDVIYIGTGSDAIRSNVIVGKGIYKSTDAGESWSFIGLKNVGQIGSVIIHPENPDIVFVAAMGQPFRKNEERGVYRTLNGGENWEKVIYLNDSVGAVDLEFAPDNSNIIYAAMWRAERKPWTIISGGAEDGIFKSNDGGDSWTRKTEGLPISLIGKIDFAVSADKPERVWAAIQASEGQEGIYRSDDYAETWVKVEMPSSSHSSIMHRPFYFTNLDANPQNADNIWAGGASYLSSYDGGLSWRRVSITHGDHQDLWINPIDTLIIIEGNDGGASVTRDGGGNWSTLLNQPTAELYSCDIDDQYPYYLYSGQQDNSSIRVPSSRPHRNAASSRDMPWLSDLNYWENVGGCETGPVVPKPGDPNIVYTNCKGQFGVYNVKLGVEHNYYVGAESLYGNHPDDMTYRFQRVSPIEVSPHNPEVVYYGSQFLHRTTNGGKNWETISPDLTANKEAYRMRSGGPIDEDITGEEYYAVLYAIEESPLQQGLIWTGSNDGLFYVSIDGGENWTNVTPDMPEGGRVSNIEASPHNPARAYYAVYRDYLGDDQPYLYLTNDYGKTWERITDGKNGIPIDFPTRVVREDPEREGLLYAGTEFGIYISFDQGNQWQSFQRNLPVVPVTDIRIIRNDLALSTMGRSFWIMEDISPLRIYDPQKTKEFLLFNPRTDYSDLQKFHLTLPEDLLDTLMNMQIFREDTMVYWSDIKTNKLKADEWGMYQTHWDKFQLLKNGEDVLRGPMVAPGNFQLKMILGNEELTQDFQVLINPELEAFGTSIDDLKEQEMLAYKVALLRNEIKNYISLLQEKIADTKRPKKLEKLNTKFALLKKGTGQYDQPKLLDHVNYLYRLVSGTQQKVGEDAFIRYQDLSAQWKSFLNE